MLSANATPRRMESLERLIYELVEVDQGARYRALLAETIQDAEDAFTPVREGFRSHLGYSLAGRFCGREIWYHFRWALDRNFEGRLVLLFNRGHLEEARFIALLRLLGCTVHTRRNSGNWLKVESYRGHVGGEVDSVVTGVPLDGLQREPFLAEMKTHGQASYDKLLNKGVKASKPEHYAQMQGYMHHLKLRYALYMAVCKNTDHIYIEFLEVDEPSYRRFQLRVVNVVDALDAPNRAGRKKEDYACRFCDYAGICHDREHTAFNCRTCASSVTEDNGRWLCTRHSVDLTKEQQLKGCPQWVRFRDR